MSRSRKQPSRSSGLRAKKSLGQNFLVDDSAIRDIIDGSGAGPDDLVIEIGPGRGALTAQMAGKCRKLVGIELDERLIPVLKIACLGQDNVEIIHGDVLRTDLAELIEKQREEDPGIREVRILGNLPYYITTPILMKILREEVPVKSMTVMMQKEVADRINAHPAEKAYGSLTVVMQYYCEIEKIRDVGRNSFRPVPKVDSCVLRLSPRDVKKVHPADTEMFFRCVKTAFSMRRKTLLNCFTGQFGMTREQMKNELSAAGLDPNVRGETLTIEEFAALADHFTALGAETAE